MQTTTKDRFQPLLILLKTYSVIGPLILVALVRGAGMGGPEAVDLLEIGYVVAFVALLFAGISQLSAGFRQSAYSSFVYAGVSLLWTLVLLFLLPSLASA